MNPQICECLDDNVESLKVERLPGDSSCRGTRTLAYDIHCPPHPIASVNLLNATH